MCYHVRFHLTSCNVSTISVESIHNIFKVEEFQIIRGFWNANKKLYIFKFSIPFSQVSKKKVLIQYDCPNQMDEINNQEILITNLNYKNHSSFSFNLV